MREALALLAGHDEEVDIDCGGVGARAHAPVRARVVCGAGLLHVTVYYRLEPVVVVPITQYKAIFCGLESKVSTADLAIK